MEAVSCNSAGVAAITADWAPNEASWAKKWAGVAENLADIKGQGNMIPYIGPYLIPVLVNIQYLIILIAFLYGVVTPTIVYG